MKGTIYGNRLPGGTEVEENVWEPLHYMIRRYGKSSQNHLVRLFTKEQTLRHLRYSNPDPIIRGM